MIESDQQYVSLKAVQVLKNASSIFGIKASAEQKDNYGAIWARDTAVAGLAILSGELTELYGPLKQSLISLQQSASGFGQIPSNIKTDEDGKITSVSFGGPAGRVDTSFWWIIISIIYLKHEPDEDFKAIVEKQCEQIFNLATVWEFNGKGLMYVPMSSNWADEYVTNGYVLYDQLLRFWALSLASLYFENSGWDDKALQIKINIKQHYLLEAELDNSLYTKAQQNTLRDFDIGEKFIASFSPGDRIERYDGWSIALLLLLDIPSVSSREKLLTAIIKVFTDTKEKGIPAFWPVIGAHDSLYQSLLLNYNFNFKNKPGHFHNGGIWPVVNGFLIAGLQCSGNGRTAGVLMNALHNQITDHITDAPFTEYFDFYNGVPGGVIDLCFSASGYLLAASALNNTDEFKKKIIGLEQNEQQLMNVLRKKVEQVINILPLKNNSCVAISIAGESGSGKTTVSHLFTDILTEIGFKVMVLHQDNYFKLPPKKNHFARLSDFSAIGPQEVRLGLLDDDIHKIKSGVSGTLNVPHMNWQTDEEESLELDVAGKDVIIVDGTYTSLLKEVDYKIMINSNYKQTRKNRIKRNRETVTSFIENVLEKESEIIKSHHVNVDILLDDELNIIKSTVDLNNK